VDGRLKGGHDGVVVDSATTTRQRRKSFSICGMVSKEPYSFFRKMDCFACGFAALAMTMDFGCDGTKSHGGKLIKFFCATFCSQKVAFFL
jgi:hypothetical protein